MKTLTTTKVNVLRELTPTVPLQGEAGGGYVHADILPEPFDTATPVRINSASGMSARRDGSQSILDQAFKGEL